MQSSKSTPTIFERLKKTIENNQNEIKATTVGATARLVLGHPIDTAGSRVKVSHMPFYNFKLPYTYNRTHLNQIIFSDAINKGSYAKICSLYQGIYPATINRGIHMGSMVLQRKIEKTLRDKEELTPKEAGFATALGLGTLTAVVVAKYNQRKVTLQLKTPWVHPYASLPPTIYRNFTWFLTKSIISSPIENLLLKKGLFGSKMQIESNETQKDIADFIASCTGSAFSIPLDRVKTLIQAGKLPRGTMHGLLHIIEKEGYKALFRGSPIELSLQCLGFAIFYATRDLFLRHEEEKHAHAHPTLSR